MGMSLPGSFEQARNIHQIPSNFGAGQNTVKKGWEALRKYEEMIANIGLFSLNKTKDQELRDNNVILQA